MEGQASELHFYHSSIININHAMIHGHHNNNHHCDIHCYHNMSGVPLFLVLRSRSTFDSNVSQLQDSNLGLYHLTTDTKKWQGPVYCQLHNGDNRQRFLYRWNSTTFWPFDCKFTAVKGEKLYKRLVRIPNFVFLFFLNIFGPPTWRLQGWRVADYPAMSFVFVCQQKYIRNTNQLSWAIN